MPGKNTPTQNPTTTQTEAATLALKAVDMAFLGRECMHDMRAILRAIHKLSGSDETIRDLANIGVILADDRHNMFDCEHEEAQQKLAALKGGCHA